MLTQAFQSLESTDDIGVRIVSNRAVAVFARALGTGLVVATGIILLVGLGAPLVDRHGGLILALTGVAYVLAIASKRRFGTDLFAGAALILTGSVLKRNCRWTDAVPRVVGVTAGNLIGAVIVGYSIHRTGLLTHTNLLEIVAAKKLQASAVSVFTQGVLCNWSLTMAAWAYGRFTDLRRRFGLIGICFLFFLGSGYEHGIANAVLLTTAYCLPNGSIVPASAAVTSVLVATLGNLASGAIISRYGFKALGERRAVPREE